MTITLSDFNEQLKTVKKTFQNRPQPPLTEPAENVLERVKVRVLNTIWDMETSFRLHQTPISATLIITDDEREILKQVFLLQLVSDDS